MSQAIDRAGSDDAWLALFHRGDRRTLEDCYREQFEVVDAAVGRLLRGADRETVVHEVFFRVIEKPDFRRSFSGGSLAGWLTSVAKNLATDHLRKQQREKSVPLDEVCELAGPAQRFEEAAEARQLIEKFKREVLPAKWHGVFQARFIEQRDQRDAAKTLGIARTTLAYQELRIRALLRRFLLKGEAP